MGQCKSVNNSDIVVNCEIKSDVNPTTPPKVNNIIPDSPIFSVTNNNGKCSHIWQPNNNEYVKSLTCSICQHKLIYEKFGLKDKDPPFIFSHIRNNELVYQRVGDNATYTIKLNFTIVSKEQQERVRKAASCYIFTTNNVHSIEEEILKEIINK